MDKAKEVKRIEREAVAARLSTIALCDAAGINKSTWWRNRQNPETMSLDTLGKLEIAIKRRKAELAGK